MVILGHNIFSLFNEKRLKNKNKKKISQKYFI